MSKARVLIFPSGSEVGLEIYYSIRHSVHVDAFGLSSKEDHTPFVYPGNRFLVDEKYHIANSDFLVHFNTFISEHKIQYIFPAHDDVALYLSERQNEIEAKVLVSCVETSRIAREKKLIYQTFYDFDFCPQIFAPHECKVFPVVAKPNVGQGGRDVTIIYSEKDLEKFVQGDTNEFIFMEYLPGVELTVDCFTNSKGDLLFIGPRVRKNVQAGIATLTERVKLTEEIKTIAQSLNNNLRFTGAWYFQVKRDKGGKLKLLEFSVRQSSSMVLYRYLGINFALLTLFDAMGMDVEVLQQNYPIVVDRHLQNKVHFGFEYHHVYIDLDDTILINGKVSLHAIAFLYQCLNDGIPVTLLTKHKNIITETFKNYKIPKELFSEIIVINSETPKAEYVIRKDSIFIDNHFLERKAVSKLHAIPVFDVDSISGLIKYW